METFRYFESRLGLEHGQRIHLISLLNEALNWHTCAAIDWFGVDFGKPLDEPLSRFFEGFE